ncbi:hypothetical protein EC968_000042 [Mortierella alpina]|nr:hypothetical protein EC968_000042 [Mortierella alpina]
MFRKVPHYIKYVPDEILTVVLSNATDSCHAEYSASSLISTVAINSGQAFGTTDAGADRPDDPSAEDTSVEGLQITAASEEIFTDDSGDLNSPIDLPILPPGSTVGSGTTLKTALSFIEALKRASKKAKEVDGKAPAQEGSDALAHVIKLLEAADSRQEEMRRLQKHVLDQQEEMNLLQKVADAKQDKMIQLQNQAHEKQLEMEQMARNHHEEIKQLQIEAISQLAVLQSRVQAILTQTFELHEYAIPRLFIVLPQYPSGWNILEPFTEKYRLYFLCECGEHTKAAGSNSKIPHEIHLAKHEGYEIARSTEFFKQYGQYILAILKMLKFGISVASVAVPAVAHLVNADALDHAAKGLQHLRECIEPGMDQVISKIEKDSADEEELVGNFAGQMENKEALEGADLRKLETFLKDKDENKVLGNLYRTVTDKGHVKWICIDHYRENYNQTAVATFRRTVESLGGFFDENIGLVKVKLRSRASANQLCSALRNSRSVHELDIHFDWACTGTDLRGLEDALRHSAVAILYVDLHQFRPSLTNKLSSIPTRYEVLYRLMSPPNLKWIHIVLPEDLVKLPNFTLKKPSHLRKLSSAVIVGPKVRFLAEILEAGLTVRRLQLWDDSIEFNGARALGEALNARPCLELTPNSIEGTAAQLLWEAFKTNSTMTTLNLNNSVGDHGAQALSEALSEALKANSNLTTLCLSYNSIGDNEAKALSEALEINSNLTTLYMQCNSIGGKGAQALSEALMKNSTLTILYLSGNSFGDHGAQALSEALKNNSTLTRLDLDHNSIGDEGAQALSEALKLNFTLTTINLLNNTIGDYGAQALSEALKINSTLTILSLQSNSIGDDGAQALSETLKTNSTVTLLDLDDNSIGDSGAQALSEVLKINSTLTTLDLRRNPISVKGVQALDLARRSKVDVMVGGL